jgi:predicted GNAT family N-acyltransferase
MTATSLRVEIVEVQDIRPLRARVLRPHQPYTSTLYPHDTDPTTLHLAGYHMQGAMVVCASVYREARPKRQTGWRIRGMATEPDLQGKGLGSIILRWIIHELAARGGGELWCNARVKAVPFYRRNGFALDSEEFEIEGIGPHFVMTRWVDPA